MHHLSRHQLQVLLDATTERLVLTVAIALHRCNVRRGEDGGLGMQVRGCCPTYVWSILTGGPAEEQGVKLGDHLWEVNGI